MLLIRQSEATVQIQDSGIRQWVEDQYQVMRQYSQRHQATSNLRKAW